MRQSAAVDVQNISSQAQIHVAQLEYQARIHVAEETAKVHRQAQAHVNVVEQTASETEHQVQAAAHAKVEEVNPKQSRQSKKGLLTRELRQIDYSGLAKCK